MLPIVMVRTLSYLQCESKLVLAVVGALGHSGVRRGVPCGHGDVGGGHRQRELEPVVVAVVGPERIEGLKSKRH